MLLAEVVGSTAAIGYGLAAIGPGIGVGLVFSAYIQSTARPKVVRGRGDMARTFVRSGRRRSCRLAGPE